jgi:hypothetical protein
MTSTTRKLCFSFLRRVWARRSFLAELMYMLNSQERGFWLSQACLLSNPIKCSYVLEGTAALIHK